MVYLKLKKKKRKKNKGANLLPSAIRSMKRCSETTNVNNYHLDVNLLFFSMKVIKKNREESFLCLYNYLIQYIHHKNVDELNII